MSATSTPSPSLTTLPSMSSTASVSSSTTPSLSLSFSPSISISPSATLSLSFSISSSISISLAATPSLSFSLSPSLSLSLSPSISISSTVSLSKSSPFTSLSTSPSSSLSKSHSLLTTPSSSPSLTSSQSNSHSLSTTPSSSASTSPSLSTTPSSSPSRSTTSSASPSDSHSPAAASSPSSPSESHSPAAASSPSSPSNSHSPAAASSPSSHSESHSPAAASSPAIPLEQAVTVDVLTTLAQLPNQSELDDISIEIADELRVPGSRVQVSSEWRRTLRRLMLQQQAIYLIVLFLPIGDANAPTPSQLAKQFVTLANQEIANGSQGMYADWTSAQLAEEAGGLNEAAPTTATATTTTTTATPAEDSSGHAAGVPGWIIAVAVAGGAVVLVTVVVVSARWRHSRNRQGDRGRGSGEQGEAEGAAARKEWVSLEVEVAGGRLPPARFSETEPAVPAYEERNDMAAFVMAPDELKVVSQVAAREGKHAPKPNPAGSVHRGEGEGEGKQGEQGGEKQEEEHQDQAHKAEPIPMDDDDEQPDRRLAIPGQLDVSDDETGPEAMGTDPAYRNSNSNSGYFFGPAGLIFRPHRPDDADNNDFAETDAYEREENQHGFVEDTDDYVPDCIPVVVGEPIPDDEQDELYWQQGQSEGQAAAMLHPVSNFLDTNAPVSNFVETNDPVSDLMDTYALTNAESGGEGHPRGENPIIMAEETDLGDTDVDLHSTDRPPPASFSRPALSSLGPIAGNSAVCRARAGDANAVKSAPREGETDRLASAPLSEKKAVPPSSTPNPTGPESSAGPNKPQRAAKAGRTGEAKGDAKGKAKVSSAAAQDKPTGPARKAGAKAYRITHGPSPRLISPTSSFARKSVALTGGQPLPPPQQPLSSLQLDMANIPSPDTSGPPASSGIPASAARQENKENNPLAAAAARITRQKVSRAGAPAVSASAGATATKKPTTTRPKKPASPPKNAAAAAGAGGGGGSPAEKPTLPSTPEGLIKQEKAAGAAAGAQKKLSLTMSSPTATPSGLKTTKTSPSPSSAASIPSPADSQPASSISATAAPRSQRTASRASRAARTHSDKASSKKAGVLEKERITPVGGGKARPRRPQTTGPVARPVQKLSPHAGTVTTITTTTSAKRQ